MNPAQLLVTGVLTTAFILLVILLVLYRAQSRPDQRR